ncbi:hypothetical protein F4821DRAFT_222781 [Hypoxylon rubiginosum]|uniref:Uncharacterized protein n=1 Tax=Hypoxylon rubiginosum TaxID=110542 RepID=A0ACC0DKM0_9PEZI|nr:hypothetical protein F4821DRAFT_222781 [Hypoxylon rubiginosum]
MQALRTRAACVARRTRPTAQRTSRSYASESHGHDHHHAPEVAEGLGTAFYVFAALVPASYIGYSISRPGANGEPSAGSRWLSRNFDYFNDWEVRNTLRTNIFEQAAHDKHLLMYSGKSTHVELKTPELFNSGSPWSVPAGHLPNLDHVTEHYRKQAAAEEDRKFQKLAEKSKQEQESSS